MDLKDFIKQTIEQIVEGVAEAQSSIQKHGANINPINFPYTADGKYNHSKFSLPQDVLFDIGLTSIEKNGSTEGIGVFLGSINLGKKNEGSVESLAVTKVKFSVPLAFSPGIDHNSGGMQKVKISGI
jgi:hypothetical protein